MARFIDVILRGDSASQPLATVTPPGSLYYVTDEQVTERVADDGLTWEDYTDAGGGGGGGVAIAAGTQTATTSTIVFSNSNGITFGMSGSTRITASHNGLTTAMASNRGSDFVQATAVFNGTNASGTIASGAISVSVGNYITTGALSGDTTKYVQAWQLTGNTAGTTSSLQGTKIHFQGGNSITVSGSSNTIVFSVGNYLTTAMASNRASDFVAATAAFAGTNASGTINSTGISVSVAPPSAGSVNFSAGTTSGNLTAVTFANSNGVSFGLDAGTITATVQTNYLTTAMASNRGSDFVQANAVFHGTNASGTIASNAISVSVAAPGAANINVSAGTTSNNLTAITFSNANGVSFGLDGSTITATVATNYQSQGAYLTTAALSGDTSKYVQAWELTGNTAGTTSSLQGTKIYFSGGNSITVSGNSNTVVFSVGNYITTARASTDAIGLNTAQSNVTWTVNSSGLSFDARGYAGTGTSATNATFTLNSNGLALSVGAGGNEANHIVLTGNTAGNTTASGTTIAWSGGNGVTLSGTNGSVVGISVNTYSTVGTATSGYPVASANSIGTITRWAAEDHRHAGIGAIGISTAGSGNTGSVVGTYWLSGINDINMSQITSNNGSHTLVISGKKDLYWANVDYRNMVTGASAITQTSGSSLFVQPLFLPYGLGMSYMRFLASFNDSAVGTAGTTQANTTFSCERYTTIAVGLHYYAGASSLSSYSSSSAGITGRTIYSAGNTGSHYTMTLQKTYPATGANNVVYTTSYAVTSASIIISSQSNTLFTGPRFLDVPFTHSIGGGWWYLAIGASTSSASNSSNLSFVGTAGMPMSLAGVSQSNVSVGILGAVTSASSNQIFMGQGVWTTNAFIISRDAMGLGAISQVLSNPILPVQFIGHNI